MEEGLYALEFSKRVSYVKSSGYLYLKADKKYLGDLKNYIDKRRGVYILEGDGRIYVGEGDVYNRLMRHTKDKLWSDTYYVLLKDDEMTKEESLVLEGSILNYFKGIESIEIENRDRTRDTELSATRHIKVFSWLGLTVAQSTQGTIWGNEQRAEVVRTSKGTYRVIYIEEPFTWLIGYEFQTKEDIYKIIGVAVTDE